MSSTTQVQLKRKEIPFFEGVNMLVSHNIAKIQELSIDENARSTEIGTIEKRGGYRRLGDDTSSTANYGLYYFESTNSVSKHMWRISTVSAITSIYYLNTSDNWTALTGSGTGIFQLGGATTQFDITNPSGSTFTYTWDTNGTDPDIDAHLRVGNQVVIAAQNFAAGNNGTFTLTAVTSTSFSVTNASGVVESNKTIGTGSITITASNFSFTTAEGCMFMANGQNDNMYITSGGTTVTTSATTTGHLYNSPKAYLINYYKDRLYVGNYFVGSTQYKNGIMRSSTPLGIVALVDGDHAQPITSLKVTDTKYIQSSDSLDVYRGGTKIGDITVTAKSEDTLTISSFATDLESADELWVDGTYSGARVFRWVDNPASGEDVKEYDTFKLSGGENDALTMLTNVGDVMVVSNKRNMAIWNDYSLAGMDLGFGCVSAQGWVKAYGTLFFLGYDGIYATTGGLPKLISAKVQKIFDGATKASLEAAALGKKGLNIFVAVGDVTLYNKDGSTDRTLTNVVVEYNLRQENFHIHTGIDAHFFQNYYTTTDVERLEFAAGSDEVYEFLYGTMDNNANEIHFRADSQPITLSSTFENVVYPYKIVIEAERGSAIQCFVSLDGDDFYEIQGEAVKGCTIMHVTSPNYDEKPARCRKITVSLRESSKTICSISRVAIVYADTYDEELFKKQYE